MKTRNFFVSNSSSSSFIVISKGLQDAKLKIDDNVFVLGEFGETEFGWQVKKYSDIYSKINFCYLQAQESDNQEYKNMLEKVLKEKFPDIHTILPILGDWKCENKTVEHPVWGNEIEIRCGYIDHQSSAYEGQNIEMFVSEDNLKNFLFNDSSYIQNDNDNH